MGKYERKREIKRKPYKVVLVALIIVLACTAFILFVLPQILYVVRGEEIDTPEELVSGDAQTVETSVLQNTPVEQEAVQFPMLAEGGKLEITSVFPFDGVNPDSGKQDGEGIAAITLTNRSDEYLDSATVRVAFADGTEHTFLVYGIPAEKTVMAFSVDHLPLSDGSICVGIHTESDFEKTQNDDRLDVSASAMSITLSNITDTELSNVVVYYHDVFDDQYFGGIVYTHRIDTIPAGESVTITALDSLMGVIDIALIVADD